MSHSDRIDKIAELILARAAGLDNFNLGTVVVEPKSALRAGRQLTTRVNGTAFDFDAEAIADLSASDWAKHLRFEEASIYSPLRESLSKTASRVGDVLEDGQIVVVFNVNLPVSFNYETLAVDLYHMSSAGHIVLVVGGGLRGNTIRLHHKMPLSCPAHNIYTL